MKNNRKIEVGQVRELPWGEEPHLVYIRNRCGADYWNCIFLTEDRWEYKYPRLCEWDLEHSVVVM